MNSSSAADFASATVPVIASVMAPAILLTLLIGAAAAALVLARRRWSPATDALLNDINRLLPQTQCAQCGYPGCKPYAQAIATGEAINRCPPGGESTIAALAELLGRPEISLDATCGETLDPHVAVIREDECIGCTLCIQACPVDAIVGAQQTMHTVIKAACTGCDLCREPCPVDCIDLVPVASAAAPIEFPITTTPCINCGECGDACPRGLQPQLLHWFRDDTDRSETLRLDACIECRRCDAVCPSEIPLTPTFRAMKQIKQQRNVARREADRAEERFEARDSRLIASTARVQARPSRLDREKLLKALKGPA